MNNPIKSIGILISSVFMAAILLTATYSSKTTARTMSIHSENNGNNINIYNEKSNNRRVYEVNGKKIYWKDLTKEQQVLLTTIENKIDKVEKQLELKEEEIQRFSDKLEVKAKAIEQETLKFELATIKIDKTVVNMQDVEEMMEKLERIAEVNESIIFENEAEMGALEEKIDAIDMSFSKEIDAHVEELETVLVAIAAELN